MVSQSTLITKKTVSHVHIFFSCRCTSTQLVEGLGAGQQDCGELGISPHFEFLPGVTLSAYMYKILSNCKCYTLISSFLTF